MPFRDLPIKRKLALVIFLTNLIGLVLAYIVLLGYEVHVYRQNTLRALQMIGEIIASNSAAALIYDNQKVAQEVLSGLQARPGTMGAALYDRNGKLFAQYPATLPATSLPVSPPADGITFHANDLVLVLPVIQSGHRVGTLFLQTDLQTMYDRLLGYGLVLLGVLAGSSLVALFFSNVFQRGISQPLLDLAETAKIVSERKDYAVRAAKASNDELGYLTTAFNSMLEQVQASHSALRASEERLSAVFEQAGAGIAQADLSGRFVMVNDRFCEIVGRARAELLQLRINDITYPADIVENDEMLKEVRLGGKASVVDKRYMRPDQPPVWVRTSVVALRNAQGRIDSTLAVVQDITASKSAEQALRESEARFRFVTDSAPVLLAQIDRNHRYTFANRPYAARYGRLPHEIIGMHVSELAGREAYETARPHVEMALDGKSIELEVKVPYEKLGERWVHFTYTPEIAETGEVLGFVAVINDITVRKSAELELERARDQALAASRAKDDFLAALSHELRTPLNPVLLLASEGAVNPDLPAAVREDFATIRKSAELEARLIDDLLDLTRISHGKLALEQSPLDLQAIVSDAIAIVRPDLEQKQIGLTLDFHADGRLISGDAVRLQQVFWNVLKNAVKFTPVAGKISVETGVDEKRRVIMLRISDTGIGLAPDELDRIFQAFSQGNHAGSRSSHRFGGLGLGLAISRMLIELHGGSIRATSAGLGAGAAFVIELPLAGTAANEAPAAASPATGPFAAPPKRRSSNPPVGAVAPSPAGRRVRILLVDDHAPTRVTLVHLLGRRHYEVVAAASMAEAIAFAHAGEFDVVVSDIGLPDGDGYTLLKELRRSRPGLPGIALSGYGTEQDIARSREAGFGEHLTKPISIGTLERALAAILRGLQDQTRPENSS